MDITEIRAKILETGWQSWSPRKKSWLGIPSWNNPPMNDNYLPDELGVRTSKKPVSGWCSWYTFGPNITEEKILTQTKWFSQHKEIPIKYILIDRGWQKWKDIKTALTKVAREITKLGFKPGIWLAPFNKGNKFEVDDFVKFGFELIKLDFLYRAYLIPKITSQEAGDLIRNMLLEIKNKYPSLYTIACGCPLLPAVNAVDSMRIGPDTIEPITGNIPVWNSLINSYKLNLVINNIKRRFWTRKFWNLDPDVFVCRKSLGLNDGKLLSLQKHIKLASGNIFFGDDMTRLGEDRIRKFVLPLFK